MSMKLLSFKQFLAEEIQRTEAQQLYDTFKSDLVTRYTKINPNFEFVDRNHIITQIVKRSSPPEISGEPNNIQITKEELIRIFDVIIDRFLRSKEDGGISTQTSPNTVFKVNVRGEWEFQHKIFINNTTHYRCIIYFVKIRTEKGVNGKGKEYLKVVGIDDFKFITINPSDRAGKDNPLYANNNAITESLDDMLNEIED